MQESERMFFRERQFKQVCCEHRWCTMHYSISCCYFMTNTDHPMWPVSHHIADGILLKWSHSCEAKTACRLDTLIMNLFCSLCVLEIVRRLNDIPWTAIKRFFTRQLNRFFTMPSQEHVGKKISLNLILTSLRIPCYPPVVAREENS